MTETPKRTDDAAREPSSEPTTEPTPAASVSPAETTRNAPGAGRQRAGWRWPQTARNRIAAGVGIAAAAVAIVAGIFTGGVVAGEHAGDGLGPTGRGYHAQVSADRQGAPFGEILIVPGGGSAAGHEGLIVAGFQAVNEGS